MFKNHWSLVYADCVHIYLYHGVVFQIFVCYFFSWHSFCLVHCLVYTITIWLFLGYSQHILYLRCFREFIHLLVKFNLFICYREIDSFSFNCKFHKFISFYVFKTYISVILFWFIFNSPILRRAIISITRFSTSFTFIPKSNLIHPHVYNLIIMFTYAI